METLPLLPSRDPAASTAWLCPALEAASAHLGATGLTSAAPSTQHDSVGGSAFPHCTHGPASAMCGSRPGISKRLWSQAPRGKRLLSASLLRAAAGAAVLQANLIHTHRHGQLGDFRSVRLIIPIASILSKSAIFVIVMKTQRAHSRTSWVAKHQHLCSQPSDTASVRVQRRNHHLGLQPPLGRAWH